MNKVRVGIIGLGKMGGFHLQKYLLIPNVEVVGIYEPNQKRAEEILLQFGVRNFASLSDLLFEADAVSICSNTETHFTNCKLALEAGVHVLIEKPMTGLVEQAESLIELAQQKQLILQVGYLERFRFDTALSQLSSRDFNHLSAQWLATELPRDQDINVIDDILVHPLDLILSLFNEEPIAFQVSGVNFRTGLVDLVNVGLQFASGRTANLLVSRVSPERKRELFLFGPKEQVGVDFLNNQIEINSVVSSQIETQLRSIQVNDVLFEQCSAFVRAVIEKSTPRVSGFDALRVLQTAKKIGLLLNQKRNAEIVPLEQGVGIQYGA